MLLPVLAWTHSGPPDSSAWSALLAGWQQPRVPVRRTTIQLVNLKTGLSLNIGL